VHLGEKAAREMRQRLAGLARATAAHIATRESSTRPPIIRAVRLNNQSRLGEETIRSHLHQPMGQPLDRERLEADITTIYGLDVFESVRYELEGEPDNTALILHVREKSWGPNYLQFGLKLSDNFEGESAYNIGVLYTRTAINSLNGELRFGGQIGQDPGLIAEWYQPLDTASRYFVNSKLFVARDRYSIWQEDDIVAEYNIGRVGLDLAVGREFGNWGEGRLGYRWGTGTAEAEVGDPELKDYDFTLGEVYARLFLDKLDNVYFPHAGYKGWTEYRASLESLGADHDYDQLLTSFAHAYTFGRHTFIGSFALNLSLNDDAPPESQFRAGGFMRFSGYQPNQLSGYHVGLLGLVYYRRISDLKLLPAYVGGSIEYGNVWQELDEIGFDNAMLNGSLFIGADTPIGPVYLGVGLAEGGRSTTFLYLGPAF
jgi:NTE family protein